jgi:hypothetical protein
MRKGRLTSGDAPLHVRRKHLANAIKDAKDTLSTMLRNWPAEFECEPGHDVFQLIEVMGVVADNLEEPTGDQATP